MRYVSVDVFDTLDELVRTTRLAAAAVYVRTRDYWVSSQIRPVAVEASRLLEP